MNLITKFLVLWNMIPKIWLESHRRADVAQSKAVSPAPNTITVPKSWGNSDLQAHMPGLEALAT